MLYRESELLVREASSGNLKTVCSEPYTAVQSLPKFMIDWGRLAAPLYGKDRIITSTVNASKGCQIGDKALCGRFCFSHLGWQGDAAKRSIPEQYRADAQRLADEGLNISVFLSTDTEPLPGHASEVTDITRRLLEEMIQRPPQGLILHTHTDVAAGSEILPILNDIKHQTNLIVGIGFETDIDGSDLPAGLPQPFTSIKGRLNAMETLAKNGVKTQAAVAPLVGFRDFETFGRIFKDIGAYRVMVGDLRLDFAIGGTAKAATLKKDLGLPAPTEQDAKAYFETLGFPPERVAFRDQFYVVLPEREEKDAR